MKASHKKWGVLLVCCILLSGCGRQKDNMDSVGTHSSENTDSRAEVLPAGTTPPAEDENYFLAIDRNMVFDIVAKEIEEPTDQSLSYVGMQFYHGEPVLLYVKPLARYGSVRTEDGEYKEMTWPNPDSGLYAYGQDGFRELLIPGEALGESLSLQAEMGVSEYGAYHDYNWYVDDDGNCYCTPVRPADGESCFLKIAKTGQLCYKTMLEPGFTAVDFCCVDGNMYVVMSGRINQADKALVTYRVVNFDPGTGILAEQDYFKTERKYSGEYFGEGADGLYLYSTYDRGILKINPGDGSTATVLSFAGGGRSNLSSGWIFRDFVVKEDGSAEALYLEQSMTYPDKTARGIAESIRLVRGERIRLTLRTEVAGNWLKEQARKFNLSNGNYWLELEEFSTSTADDPADYARLTGVELATGKGPDILCGSLIGDSVQGLLDKDMLLELGGMLEASGIRQEDYLPAAFNSWGMSGKVYGINPYLYPVGYKLRGDILGISGTPDIQTLMNALSGYEGEAVYYARNDAADTLRMFLQGSDDLWGTVNWGNGTCDFGGELFTQILENAGRFGYRDSRRCISLTRSVRYESIYRYDSQAELKSEKMVMAGVLFNDGCHGCVDSRNTLAINAASQHKEGAWEFLCFLLEEGSQAETDDVPVNRAALSAWLEKELKEVADREQVIGYSYIDEDEIVSYHKVYTAADMTEERRAEYLKALENVRILPQRTEVILDIICEEAGAYFCDGKSISAVIGDMQNRVQLYLNERR